jgi:hypothetical protein
MQTPPAIPVVSKRKLLTTTALALLAAIVIVLVAVLPAEFGKDPTGLGELLGLKTMGQLKINSAGGDETVAHPHDRKPRSARIEIAVNAREELEYKAQLDRGEPLLYHWSVQGGPVHFEFHGEPTEGDWPDGYFRSYETGDTDQGRSGSFVAPFAGRHGWYWRNDSDEPAVIVLEASGYYSKLGRIGAASARTE